LTIIPEDERSSLPLDTDEIIYHPDMIRANEWILTEYKPPVRDFCIFVPCAKKKPYHESPSHKIFDKVIFGMLKPEEVHVVVFGTCGITPRELDTEYPFMDYQFMLGKCNVAKIKRDFIKMESQRLAEYLEKTKDNYKHRIAYCIGDFRKAMELAVEMSGVEVTIVPKDETVNSHIQPGKKFIYGSLNQASYLQDFSDAIASSMGKDQLSDECSSCNSKEEKEALSEEDATNVNDNDWYII
jgi:predicted RNA-binding protein